MSHPMWLKTIGAKLYPRVVLTTPNDVSLKIIVTDFDDEGDLLGSVCLGVSKYLQPIARLVRRT